MGTSFFCSALNKLLMTFAIYFLCGCQTAPIKDFETVSLGHDKSDVLETIGGPSWQDRRKGFDRWTYIIYQDGVRLERQIYFLDGIVTYKGDPIQPFITAEEQDETNAEKNLALDRLEASKMSSSKMPKPSYSKPSSWRDGESR
jgi:outer membrane protein assembly factor BamE